MSSVLALFRPASAPARNSLVRGPVRVEPKVFFANERTFLSWLHFSILLATLAVGLINFGDRVGRISGLILTATAMGAMFYSVHQFLTRARNIRKRVEGPYDDRVGPVVVATLLSGALVVNLYLKFTQAA